MSAPTHKLTARQRRDRYTLIFCFVLFALAVLLAIYSPGM